MNFYDETGKKLSREDAETLYESDYKRINQAMSVFDKIINDGHKKE